MEDTQPLNLLNLDDIAFYQKTYKRLIFCYIMSFGSFCGGALLSLVLPSSIKWIGWISGSGMVFFVAIPFLNLSLLTDTKNVVSALRKYNVVKEDENILAISMGSILVPFLGISLIRSLVFDLDKLKVHPQFLRDLEEEEIRLQSS